MSRNLFIISTLVIFSFKLFAQTNTTPCNAKWLDNSGIEKGTNPPENLTVKNDYPICSGFGATMENPLWYKFTTNNTGKFKISIDSVKNCNGKGEKGITASIFRQRTPSCSDLVLLNGTNTCKEIKESENNELDFASIGNKTYWLLIDGVDISRCDFTLKYDVNQLSTLSSDLKVNCFWDKNKDCILDDNEKSSPFNDITILLKQGSNTKYTLRPNEVGKFDANVLMGNYSLELRYANNLWTSCIISTLDINSPQFDLLIPIQELKNCINLESDLSTTCVENNKPSIYRLNYKNIGTKLAQNAKAILTLDENQTIVSATKPYTVQNNDYSFELGDVAPLSNNFIEIKTKNSKNQVLQRAIIQKTALFPNDLCDTPSALWDESDLAVSGKCANDSIYFTVKNNGIGVSSKIQPIVIEDLLAGKALFIDKLQPGEINTVFKDSATGKTFRFEVPQSANHPRKSMPSVTIEGCPKKGTSNFSVGFANLYPQDDAEPSIDIDIREIEDNPALNDILAFPKGYGSQNLIPQNQDIEYIIRFKNTKQDSIKRLYIIDTLPLGLDVSTLRIGNSSHRNDLIISDNRILVFAFDKINLPPTNSPGGDTTYVKFRISQDKDLPLGTVLAHRPMFYTNLEDSVGIAANSIKHTIGKNFITVKSVETLIPKISIRVYPNPTSDVAHISIENMEAYNELQLEIFDLSARLMRSSKSTSNQFDINVNDLPKGLYFFRIGNEKQIIANGKLQVN
jgi:hypothetical protein